MVIEVLDPSRILARSTQLIPEILAKALELHTEQINAKPTGEERKEEEEEKKKKEKETPVDPTAAACKAPQQQAEPSNGVAVENETSSKNKGTVTTVEDSDGIQGKAVSGGDGGSIDAEGSVSSKGKKRRESSSGGTSMKRPRLVWTPELHRRFVEAVQQLGLKNAVPKSIMQLMNVEGLSRENVASHLQKYRMYLKRTADATRGSSDSDALQVKPTPLPISTLEQQNLLNFFRGDRNAAVQWPNFNGMINPLSVPELQNMIMQGSAQNLMPNGISPMVNFGGNFFPMNAFGFPSFVVPPVTSAPPPANAGSNSANQGNSSG